MPIPLDAFDAATEPDQWPKRGRGGFMRNYHDQAIVSHPDGGKRKCAYSGASSWWPFAEPYAGDPIHGDRGTHIHSICDRADRGIELSSAFLAQGESLGIPADLQRYIYDGWLAFIEAHRIEFVGIEQPYVNDTLRAASNADRIFRFADRDGLFGGDIKSARKVESRTYAIQLATLVGSVPYDVDTDERGEWPQPIDDESGYIFHFPILDAIEADSPDDWPDWTLVEVDIAAAVHDCEALVAIRDDPTYREAFEIIPTPTASIEDRRRELHNRYNQLAAADQHAFVELSVDMDDLDAVEAALDKVDPFSHHTPPVQREPLPATPVQPPAPTTDEGSPVDPSDVATLEAHYGRLHADLRAWVNSTADATLKAGAGLNLRESPTVRRYEIMRGLIRFAGTFVLVDQDDHGESAELIHAVAAEVAAERCWPIAVLLASFDHAQATEFARLIDDLIDGTVHAIYGDDGRPHITRQPAA